MTRTKLLSILQEETDGFKEQSRLRDDVLDAMEQAYLKGEKQQLTIPVVGNCTDLEYSLYGQVVDLKEKVEKLEFMIKNGLSKEDMINDITYPTGD